MTVAGFAVVGAGNIGNVHAQAIAAIPEARLSVVCDEFEERGRALALVFGAQWAADYRQAVVRSDVDVVCVCTPSGTHAEIAEAAAQAGKHLVVEKPLDVTLERVDRIISAAERAAIKMTCIFPLRFKLGAHKAKEAIEQGRLGKIVLADASVKWYRPQQYYDGIWRGTWDMDGGGALMNQSIHSIDLLQWLVGPVDSVFGHVATLEHRIETEDTASAVVAYKNGALGVIQGATSCWPGDNARVELHGTQGTVALEDGRIVVWKLADGKPEEEDRMLHLEESVGSGRSDPAAIGYELHRRQILDFVQAVQQDHPPAVVGPEGRKAVEIILAIYRSSKTSSPVSLPLS